MVSYNYLLTYKKDGEEHYKWFATEKEMDQFIDNDPEVSVNEGVHIKDFEVVRGFKRRKACAN
mgnify:CR=1 FL=1